MSRRTVPATEFDRFDCDIAWLALLTGAAIVGGRRTRRAAMRGTLALGLTGVAAGVTRLAAHIAARSGTVARSVGIGRPTWRAAAGAAAVATAVAIEAPIAAVPLGVGLLGRAVAVQGRPAEALRGSLLGGAAAVVSVAIWPRSAATPAEAARHETRRDEQPSPTGEGLVVICNDAAGASAHRAELAVIERELPDAEIVRVADAARIEPEMHAAARRAKALGVVGGDGTISTAAVAATDAGIPLLVVPGGTLNHFARDLGIDDPATAVAALRAGEALEVDLGRIDGRIFLNTASFGTYSEFVRARERYERRIGKWPAVLVALWRTVLNCEPLTVTINDRRRRIWTIFVGNCEYDPPGFAPATRARLDDGQFDVRIIDGTRPAARLRLVTAVLTGRVARSTVYTRELVDRIDVHADASRTPLAADGEVFDGGDHFTIVKAERRLAVFAPHR